jgi:hypothetical protein
MTDNGGTAEPFGMPVDEPSSMETAAAIPDSAGETRWTDALGEGVRDYAAGKGWRDADALVESYRHLERKIGERGLPLPAAEVDDAAWERFHAAAGRPERPEDYDFAMPDDLPEDFAYSEEMAGQMRGWAHAAGLNPRQAQKLHDAYVGHLADWHWGYRADLDRRRDVAEAELRADWGGAYRRNRELAGRAMDAFGGAPLRDALKAMGLKDDPRLVRAFAKAGELIAEDGMVGEGTNRATGRLGARAEIERLSGDGDFLARLTDRDRPGHADAVRRWSDLHARAFDDQ